MFFVSKSILAFGLRGRLRLVRAIRLSDFGELFSRIFNFFFEVRRFKFNLHFFHVDVSSAFHEFELQASYF